MTQEFVEKLGQLIKLSKPLNNGDLNIDAICGNLKTFIDLDTPVGVLLKASFSQGNGTTSDYIDAIIGILDMFIHNKEILESFANEVSTGILITSKPKDSLNRTVFLDTQIRLATSDGQHRHGQL